MLRCLLVDVHWLRRLVMGLAIQHDVYGFAPALASNHLIRFDDVDGARLIKAIPDDPDRTPEHLRRRVQGQMIALGGVSPHVPDISFERMKAFPMIREEPGHPPNVIGRHLPQNAMIDVQTTCVHDCMEHAVAV